MKIVPRVTNSFVITAALLAVIIGSLCFSAGEGLRLQPFPSVLAGVTESVEIVDVDNGSLSKYGPIDIPTQTQKRGKRNVLEVAAGPRSETQAVFTSIVHSFLYEEDSLICLSHAAPPPGRAPPLHS